MKNKQIYFIIGALALVLFAIFSALQQNNKRLDWRETYEAEKKDPYGTYILTQLLNSYFPNKDFQILKDDISQSLTDVEKGSYVFVGQGIVYDSLELETLLSFVKQGNQAFLSSRTIPTELIYAIVDSFCYDLLWDDYFFYYATEAKIDLEHPDLQLNNNYAYKRVLQKNESNYHVWAYIDSAFFCEQTYSLVKIGNLADTLTNFAKLPYGEGIFYLHTTPIAFSNIHLLEKEGVDYASKVFSHLKEGNIYWDAANKVSEQVARGLNQTAHTPNRNLSAESPLQYILSQPPLAWGWYIILAMGLLYLLFRAKRQQKVIPVLEQNKNTSLEFVATIGRLYFLQHNHRKLCLQKMQFFLSEVRAQFGLATNQLDDDFVQKLASSAEVPVELINKILLYHKNIEASNYVSENTLVEFHQLISSFWSKDATAKT